MPIYYRVPKQVRQTPRRNLVTTLNIELLDALKKAGVDDETARAAAKAVLGIEAKEQLATKADLAELKAEIQAM
jgi:hypothetical protein